MEQERNYIGGFNTGYKMAQYNPELWEKLKPSLSPDSEYERGVLEGAQEYEKEKEKIRETDLSTIRENKNQSKEKDLNR